MVNQVFYYNQAMQYPAIQKDYKQVKNHVQKIDATDKTISMALDALPAFRKFSTCKEKIKDQDYFSAVGLASLAAINFEEDIKDVRNSTNQIKSYVNGKKYNYGYDYTKYQHAFSFFRGTLLEKFADPTKNKNKYMAQKLSAADKVIADTKFGNKILNLLGVREGDLVQTTLKDIGYNKENPNFISVKSYKGSAFGQLTARAMNRIPILGLAIISLFEIPKIFKTMKQKNDSSTLKQIEKSSINIATIATTIAYSGAIGAKRGGPTGSLIGMGIGAILGTILSNKLQNIISA